MPSDKDRLYVALYDRRGSPTMPGLEDKYHWALIVGPETESEGSRGYRFHVKAGISFVGNPPMPHSSWQYEELGIFMLPTAKLLVRIMVGEVKSMNKLRSIFERTPVRLETEGWNCVAWVKEALLAAIQDGKALGTSARDWESVRDAAMWYVEHKKAAHRFDGIVRYDEEKAPTWDMLESVELIP